MGASTADRIARMSPSGRRFVRIVGVLLIVAGAALLALAFATFLQYSADPPEGEAPSGVGGMTAMMLYILLGSVLVIVGVFLLRMGQLKGPVRRYPEGEGGEGASRSGIAPESATTTCPTCGSPERAGGKHCSECGFPL